MERWWLFGKRLRNVWTESPGSDAHMTVCGDGALLGFMCTKDYIVLQDWVTPQVADFILLYFHTLSFPLIPKAQDEPLYCLEKETEFISKFIHLLSCTLKNQSAMHSRTWITNEAISNESMTDEWVTRFRVVQLHRRQFIQACMKWLSVWVSSYVSKSFQQMDAAFPPRTLE